MNYTQTLEYLYAQLPMFHRVGGQAYKANLDNTIALCNLLNNPQNTFRTIHVTGTNGKGSVSHILASILQTAGHRTGLYTSPHLKDFRERIRVNGKKIPSGSVAGFINRYRDNIEKIKPSFFELTVGMAFDYFRHQQVDIAVIEVGMGGRLDSTNIIHPILSVITNVGYDHTQFLGNTLDKIAVEKAGIIKSGIPVVIGETDINTQRIFINTAEENQSEIVFADQLFSVNHHQLTGTRQNKRKFEVYKDNSSYINGLVLPLAGQYQCKNILTVLAACEQLKKYGYSLPESAVLKGTRNVIKNTGLQGRWQVIGTRPLIICDTGHNESGLLEVIGQIATTPHKHLHFVFGVVKDKNLDPILALLPENATYYFCQPDIPRAMDSFLLEYEAHKAGLKGARYASVSDALTAAKKSAALDDLIFVGGSTFVVAEVVN